ncbi:MAG: DUF3326 domain-containing protein [Microcoleus sp.]
MNLRPLTVVLIVPTGIGASIGGCAGDALPVARAIAQVADTLITHPNVLNGAQLYWPIPNALYVEGYALDKFASGCWGLQPVHQNRIGLILDAGIEPDLQLRQLQAADAARATLGLEITDCVLTDRPLEVELRMSESGASWGTIAHPDSLLRAAEKLITQAKVKAIAVVARFPDDAASLALENYRRGKGVDPLAGAEAVISHLIVRTFQIPCAHAPALLPLPLDPHISPRSAAEEIGYTFLPCVLAGLSKSPQLVALPNTYRDADRDRKYSQLPITNYQLPITADRVDVVVIPATACGSSAILNLSGRSSSRAALTSVQIIAVKDNKTQMQAPPEKLGIAALQVNSYLEAIGMLVALKAGISPASLSANISPLRYLSE